jgi:DNA modification methylase
MPKRIQRTKKHAQAIVPQTAAIPAASVNDTVALPALDRLVKQLEIEHVAVEVLRAPTRQLRRHSERKLAKLQANIRRFGFLCPLLAGADNELIVGVARLQVARRMGLKRVPLIRASHLSPEDIRIFRIADNRLTELSDWDEDNLGLELKELSALDLGFSLELSAFDAAEIDLRIDALSPPSPGENLAEAELEPPVSPTSRLGDLWRLGDHSILCGDALQPPAYEALMGNEQARMIAADLPYNLKIDGHVGGLGKVHHRPFAMASGEMSEEEFTDFLSKVFLVNRSVLMRGGLAYYFMDWRHCHEITTAQRRAGFDLINLCIWAKTNGGMGSLYRSRHEMVFVFGERRQAHVNNVQLGRFGRYRTNVWEYPGANSFRKGRDQDLADHPTVKNMEMIADAIRDVTNRGDIVLDPFVGSGTTVLAAERTGRRARAVEIDPAYVDVAIGRWSKLTDQQAVLVATGQTFNEVRDQRADPSRGGPPQTGYGVRIRRRSRGVAATVASGAED